MKSYGQFCGLAQALDVVGERWTLLLLRDLLLGPTRYSRLLEGLPGLTTNLLAARLRDLEQAGLLERVREAGGRGQAYALTARGAALEPAILELARWGSPLLGAPSSPEVVNVGWALLSCKRRYGGGGAGSAELRVGGRRFELRFESGYLGVYERTAMAPDLRVTLSQAAFVEVIMAGGAAEPFVASGELRAEGDRPLVWLTSLIPAVRAPSGLAG